MRRLTLTVVSLVVLPSILMAQDEPPNINQSKEFPNVYHSPSAESTPRAFRSVLKMELVVTPPSSEAEVRYANGVVLTSDGLVASVIDQPASKLAPDTIESATLLLLDGSSVQAELVRYDAEHGLALFKAIDIGLPPLTLSKKPLVARRRLTWHTVFGDGYRTFLYYRPLQIHKAKQSVNGIDDLCEIIDTESSSLSAERSGSALLSLDGSLVALMGRQPHWNVSPKNVRPRTKVAWAVPAHVIAVLLDADKSD